MGMKQKKFFFLKKKIKMADSKKAHFSKSPILKIFSRIHMNKQQLRCDYAYLQFFVRMLLLLQGRINDLKLLFCNMMLHKSNKIIAHAI